MKKAYNANCYFAAPDKAEAPTVRGSAETQTNSLRYEFFAEILRAGFTGRGAAW